MRPTSHRPRLGALAALALLAAAVACPLPQPIPGVTRLDGGTITPPRIQVATATPSDTIVYYDPATCSPTELGFKLNAIVVDQNTDELVDVRWFVDYGETSALPPWADEQIAAPADPEQFLRGITPQRFNPVSNAWSSRNPPPHVVELVVTNGGFFNDPLPGRSPASGYEVEVFRWVFSPKLVSGIPCGP